VDLDDSNHECDGGTPLFSKANEGLGAMMTKVAELKAAGRTAQSFSVFISDGEASDEDVMLGGEHVSPLANASRLISGMTTMKQHIVCGVSIGGGADATFRSMGIANKWILSPENDEFAFNDAMRQVSRASRAASRGAGAFQTTADGGFR